MVLITILTFWISILLVVVGLCAAASRGDRQPQTDRRSPSVGGPARLHEWESAEHLAVYAHAARTAPRRPGARDPGKRLAGVGGSPG